MIERIIMNNTDQSLKEIKELIAMQNVILSNIMAMMTQLNDVQIGQEEALAVVNAVGDQILKYNCEDVKNITV